MLDEGVSWGDKLVIDAPQYAGSYAYTSSIQISDDRMWVFTRSPRSEGKGAIAGVLLERHRGGPPVL